jgi:putative transposase|tara:strand:+ start:98 stop:286 length:189 start_codon:yes stop_codon:yes gene_type:complete
MGNRSSIDFSSVSLPVSRGYLYLVAIMDWATRKVLSWRVSNTMHADFCVDALKEAIGNHEHR